jgi:DNA-binding GntR family transcriptional regulator
MEQMSKSLAEQAYQLIRSDILQCKLAPGQTVAQGQLIEQYNLSKTPVREALKRLEQEGFVQSLPRFGYLITPVTVKDIENIYELRLILEKSAVQLAARRASDAELNMLERDAQFTYRHTNTGTYQSFLETNASFHSAIALASGNRRLAENISHLLDEMTRIFHLGLELRDSAEEMKNEHITLANALRERNADLAKQITEDQIRRSQQRVLEMLNQHNCVQTQTTLIRSA